VNGVGANGKQMTDQQLQQLIVWIKKRWVSWSVKWIFWERL